EVGDVVARPLGAIPPHPFLPLAPWLSLEIGRGSVVEDATVGWPRPAPLELRARGIRRVRLFPGGEVAVRRWKHAAVDPGGARRGPVVLEVAEAREMPTWIVGVVAVDLLEDLDGVGLAALPLVRVVRVVVPDQVLESAVSGQCRIRIKTLQPFGELVGQPQVGA